MLSHFRTMAVGATFAALVAAANGTVARAALVSDFTATCTLSCTGTATGLLILTDAYVPGTVITSATFVSFSYLSSDESFTITDPLAEPDSTGGLTANGSITGPGVSGSPGIAPDTLFLTELFGVRALPSFEATAGSFGTIDPNIHSDGGTSVIFTPVTAQTVPEPASLVILYQVSESVTRWGIPGTARI
jgi:hypothetical protein